MRHAIEISLGVTCLFLILAVLAVTPAKAAMEVTESNVNTLKVGVILPDGATFELPVGAAVKLLKKPENKIWVLKGPFTGTIDDYQKIKSSKGWWTTWWDKMFGSAEKQDGGPPVGASRSVFTGRPKPNSPVSK